MGIYQEYQKYCRNFTYLEELVKEIVLIFEGAGKTQIITNSLVNQYGKTIKDFIILSNEMENALNYVHGELKDLLNTNQKFSSGMFYFSQYGGSKTQFLNIILNEIQSKIPDCIVILFNDLNDLDPIPLFNKIKQSAYFSMPRLSRFINNEQKYLSLIGKLEEISAEINVQLRLSSNLNKLIEKIGFVRNRLNKNPKLKKELIECMDLLRSSILVDSETVVKKIIDFMKLLTNDGFLFLFLFDEVDLWIDDTTDQLLFSEKFNRLHRIMKHIFESHVHEIKIFYLFACTDRVNKLFKTQRNIFTNTSPVASRFVQIYERSQSVIEPGYYGEKIEEALSKISAYFTLSNNNFKIEESFLDEALIQLKDNYTILSRRNANSQIIKLLRTYNSLKIPIEKGSKEWMRDVTKYGKLIENHIELILNQMNIKFKREQVKIDPNSQDTQDKIDGYFINYDQNEKEIKSFVEIKVTKKFKGDKVYQALQWVQLRKENIIMIIFSPDNIEEINEEIIKYALRMGFSENDINKIKILHISNPFAFSTIIGVEKVLSDPGKLVQFYKDYAFWLDFFGNFTSKYQEIKQLLGLFFKRKELPKKELKSGEEEGEKEKLPSESLICRELLVKLYNNKKMHTKTGRLLKSTIEKVNTEYSLGISNLENIFDVMKKYGIILKVNPSTVNFTMDIISIDHIEKFVEICENKLKKKPAILSY